MNNEGTETKPFDWKGCCALPAGALLALMAVVGGFSYLTHEDDKPEPSSTMASYHCREMVKEKLRDPSSAKFSDETVTGHGEYEIAGTVRATNGFGGTVAHEYECDAVWNESDDSYSVTMRVY